MKIGIIGLGLIGGSILKALYNQGIEIYAITQNPETLTKLKKYTTNASDNINDLVHCKLVFVCTPINKTIDTLDKLEKIVSQNCIVADVASVKEFVMEKKRPYKFIGSHPMAGTENSGFDYAFKELFVDAKWVLTPADNVSDEDIAKIERIIRKMDAKPVITNAQEHDLAVALISHMPLLVSQSIYEAASENMLAMKLASSGFRDMTRLAMSNITMANDMMQYNRKNITNAYNRMQTSVKMLDTQDYIDLISQIKSSREKMYSPEGKNVL